MIEDGKPTRILGKRVIPSGIIFTMNADENSKDEEACYEMGKRLVAKAIEMNG